MPSFVIPQQALIWLHGKFATFCRKTATATRNWQQSVAIVATPFRVDDGWAWSVHFLLLLHSDSVKNKE